MLVTQSCSTPLQPHGLQSTRLLCPWGFPGRNTGVGCHFLLQSIFLMQGSNLHLLCLLHWQADPLPLHHMEEQYLRLNEKSSAKIQDSMCLRSSQRFWQLDRSDGGVKLQDFGQRGNWCHNLEGPIGQWKEHRYYSNWKDTGRF